MAATITDYITQKSKIFPVRRVRMPKILRVHPLGLTTALVASLMVVGFNTISQPQSLQLYVLLVTYVLYFTIGSYFMGGPFVALTLVMAVVGSIPVGAQLLLASKLYVLLYVFGVVFAIVYNLASLWYAKFQGFTLVPAFRIPFFKKIEISFPGMRFPDVVGKFPVAFVYDPKREFNIIKSPISREEVAFNEFFQTTGFLLEEIRQNKNLKKNINKVQRKISKAFAQMFICILSSQQRTDSRF